MDLRRHKPRRQRIDEDAGLVFAWRIPGGSLARTTIALILTAGLFATAAVVINVEPRVEPVRVQESGGVTLLWEDDSAATGLLDAAHVDSPFPDRWEPRPSAVLREELERLGAELDRRGAYRPRLRPLLDPPEPPRMPGLLGDAIPQLPAPEAGLAPPGPPAQPVEVFVRAIIENDDLAGRWQGRDVRWEGEDGPSLLGREASYLLGVDPRGHVALCLAIDTGGLDSELDSLLANWLRNQEFTAAEDADETTWGVVHISFGPRRHDEQGSP